MWESILKMGDFEKVQTSKGIAICSKDKKKRYYYKSLLSNEQNESNISLIMFNSGTIDGKDKTIQYIEKVCQERTCGFDIVNLVPWATGKPEKLPEEEIKFDPLNFEIIKHVINSNTSLVWIGWGQFVKQKTSVLLPKEFRKFLQENDSRMVQIDKVKPASWYPWHPAYADRHERIEAKDLKLVPFDTKILNRYPL